MKQWHITQFSLAHLQLGESAIPQPGPRELLIRVAAVSLNYRDKLVIEGKFFPDLSLPFVPASDAAGIVESVGRDVTRFRPGDRVVTHFFTQWMDGSIRSEEDSISLGGRLPGVLSDYIVVHENGAVATPSYLTDIEASTLPIAALTAWWALFEVKPLKPGETVLVQGTGGVSLFALQFATAFGAHTIITSRSDEKLARARALGASAGINTSRILEWGQEVLALTNGRGADHVLEVAGGDAKQSLNALARGGQIALIGFLQSNQMTLEIIPFMLKFATLNPVGVGHRKAFEVMNRALEAIQIHPVIDAVYPFQEAPAAFAHLTRGSFGKVVIEIPKQ